VLAAAVALVVATIGRTMLPAVTTQAAVLLALTGLAGSTPQRGERRRKTSGTTRPRRTCSECRVLPAIAWLVVAIGLGVLGLYESRTPGDPAQRRAGSDPFWAGLCGGRRRRHVGLRERKPWQRRVRAPAGALDRRARRPHRQPRRLSSGRSAARARPTSSAAAIGLITALTDFNFRYLTDSVEVGLLVEGLILIGAGVGGRPDPSPDRALEGRAARTRPRRSSPRRPTRRSRRSSSAGPRRSRSPAGRPGRRGRPAARRGIGGARRPPP
jgi:hypothetical protein